MTVKATFNGTEETYTADQVIVTVPLTVLKKGTIEFSPELPESKVKAMDSLGIGMLDQVVLLFDECFWESDNDTD